MNTGVDPVEIATKTFTVLNPASANASKIVIDDKTEVAVDQYDKETVEFDLRNVNNKVENADYLQNVKVWATDADGNFTDAVTFTTVAGEFEKCTNNSHFYKFLGTVTEDTTFEVTFERVVRTISMLASAMLLTMRILLLLLWAKASKNLTKAMVSKLKLPLKLLLPITSP